MHERACRTGRVAVGGLALHFLDGLFVLLVCLDRVDAERHDLDAAQLTPLGRKLFVECVCNFHRMRGQRRVAHTICTNACKGGLQRSQQLAFELAVQIFPPVFLCHVAAHVGIEQHGIDNLVAVLAEAPQTNVHVDARPLIEHAERHRRRGSVLVAGQLLGVEIVDALRARRFSAEREALGHVGEHFAHAVTERTGENSRLGGRIVDELARLERGFHDLALIDDHHRLSVRHRDDRTACDDILVTLGVARPLGDLFAALDREHIRVYRITVKIFLPLVSQHTAARACCCFNKSHLTFSFYLIECRCFTIYTLVQEILFPVYVFSAQSASPFTHISHFCQDTVVPCYFFRFFVDFRRAV